MIYSFDILTPAGTHKATPLKTSEILQGGVLTLKYVILPPGCAGLVGIRICDAIHQIWPTNEDAWFEGEGTFQFNDQWDFSEPPYSLDIYSYNEDDTYDHTPILIFQVTRSDQSASGAGQVTLSQSILTQAEG